MNKIITLAILIVIVMAGVMAFIRLSPSDPALWHIALTPRPALIATPSPDIVTPLAMGGYIDLTSVEPAALLAKLDGIALASPRTTRLAGSAETGRITWVSRSLFWGFPDYTTAESTPQGVTVFARQRFGKGDWGANPARLTAWIDQL